MYVHTVLKTFIFTFMHRLFSIANFNKELELALPSNVVKGSAKATISVIG